MIGNTENNIVHPEIDIGRTIRDYVSQLEANAQLQARVLDAEARRLDAEAGRRDAEAGRRDAEAGRRDAEIREEANRREAEALRALIAQQDQRIYQLSADHFAAIAGSSFTPEPPAAGGLVAGFASMGESNERATRQIHRRLFRNGVAGFSAPSDLTMPAISLQVQNYLTSMDRANPVAVPTHVDRMSAIEEAEEAE